MKRLIPALFLILSLFAILTVTVSAGGGEIVTNPQNYRWPEYSNAVYEAKAMSSGGAYIKDADIHWFLVYTQNPTESIFQAFRRIVHFRETVDFCCRICYNRFVPTG